MSDRPPRLCSQAGCDAQHRARGLCEKHWRAARKNGMALLDQSPEARFWGKVEKTAGCWFWTAYVDRNGYGQFGSSEGKVGAHRFAYTLVRGAIPDGLVLDHLCRTPSCVNPDHLEPVTQHVNVLRGVSPIAKQARMTVCKKGLHPLAEDNLYTHSGKRRCRACYLAWRAARRAA